MDFDEILDSEFPQACKIMEIKEGETGVSYESLFGKHLNKYVTMIFVEDPYLKEPHQGKNLSDFVDLVLNKCPNLNEINIVTKNGIIHNFHLIQERCLVRNIVIESLSKQTLHDRRVRFFLSNEVQFVLGRGLDLFYKDPTEASSQMSMKCRETIITSVNCGPPKTMKLVPKSTGDHLTELPATNSISSTQSNEQSLIRNNESNLSTPNVLSTCTCIPVREPLCTSKDEKENEQISTSEEKLTDNQVKENTKKRRKKKSRTRKDSVCVTEQNMSSVETK